MEGKKIFEKGNVAIAMAALAANCKYYFGYPITPQSDIPEYLSRELPKVGGVFLQSESEVAAINMLLGAAATGARVMTSSSGPGISLMQEGISYMAGDELPAVIVNVSRSGPGLGGISPSQGDYFQATRGGGHGDYRTMVLAPHSVQDMWDYTIMAFDLADKYRNPVIVLADGMLGQMKEPFVTRIPEKIDHPPKDSWALTGAKERPGRVIKSLYLGHLELEKHVWHLNEKYEKMKKEDTRWEEYLLDDPELVVVAFGSAARIAKTAVKIARNEGYRVGLIRPITLFPYPYKRLRELSKLARGFLTIELNAGQMVEDVMIGVGTNAPTYFYGRPNGVGSLPTPEELYYEIIKAYKGEKVPVNVF